MIGCRNSDYGLKKWAKLPCVDHGCFHEDEECSCVQPYQLFNFPTKLKKPLDRKKWVLLLNRVTSSNNLWSPVKSARVCSHHFVDGAPTDENPYPTENLGYNSKRKVSNVLNFSSTPKRRRKRAKLHHNPISNIDSDVIDHDHSYSSNSSILADVDDDANQFLLSTNNLSSNSNQAGDNGAVDLFSVTLQFIMFVFGYYHAAIVLNYVFKLNYQRNVFVNHVLHAQVDSLRDENKRLKRQVEILERKDKNCRCKLSVFNQLIRNDDDINFYSGISKIPVFIELKEFIEPYVRQLWRGAKYTSPKIKRKFRSTPSLFGPQRKLSSDDQFLLMWMKIRLNTPMHDLANRFGVPIATCLRVFTSWTKASAIVLRSFVFVPSRFSSIRNLNMIIDCSELVIQTPKNHILQRITWSSYKHHNTLKFLVGISPNSMITFISNAFCGSISDKEICIQSNFFDNLPPYCKIMADKGFIITQECTARRIHLIIPPGHRGQTQMMSGQVLKTKEIAQLRILVEQVIRRLKCYRILSQEMPLDIVSNVDDILTVCSADC